MWQNKWNHNIHLKEQTNSPQTVANVKCNKIAKSENTDTKYTIVK